VAAKFQVAERPASQKLAGTRDKHMMKIKIDSSLYDRAKQAATVAGYSSVEEFVAHCIENELQKLKVDEAEGRVADQLRGLGYIE
jgi:hypothetical protein